MVEPTQQHNAIALEDPVLLLKLHLCQHSASLSLRHLRVTRHLPKLWRNHDLRKHDQQPYQTFHMPKRLRMPQSTTDRLRPAMHPPHQRAYRLRPKHIMLTLLQWLLGPLVRSSLILLCLPAIGCMA